MEYEPKTDWQYDDTVTEDDLNRIETGISEAFGLVEQTGVAAYQQISLINHDLLEITFQLQINNLVNDDTMKTVYVDTADELNINKGILKEGKVYI